MRKLSIIFLGLIMTFVAKSIKAENPNIFIYQLGDVKVTALINKEIFHDKSLFRYSSEQILGEALTLADSNKGSLNEFVVEIDDKTILFDTGLDAATTIAGLKEAGYSPEDIDLILITHMHQDHIGGLLDENYGVAFSKADIYISEEELKVYPEEYFLKVYGDRVKLFKQNENILTNVKPIPAFGHTGGHTMYELNSQGKKMLIWGDLIHAEVQFRYPEIYMIYDAASSEAVNIRESVLEKVSHEDTIVAGMHLVYPGMGVVAKLRDNWYVFEPLKHKSKEE